MAAASDRTALVVGSGPAAAGAALALTAAGVQVDVIDIGLRLDANQQSTVDGLATLAPALWTTSEVQKISAQPASTKVRGLPEKRAYGSDFPFRDIGQLDGISGDDGVNRAVVSGAYGGYSNVWGSQVMPFTKPTFDTWPVSLKEMWPHYEAVLRHIPYAGEEDDLAVRFPLIADATALPEVSQRTQRVLDAYDRHRHAVNVRGVTLGRARLAFSAAQCVRCGLCMTGCPMGLVYSASQTFDALRAVGRLRYHGGLLVVDVSEDGDHAVVMAREISTGKLHRFEADRAYLGCGAFGTTRLVASSLGLFDEELALQESAQFMLPFVSRTATDDPRGEPTFTLNQFNMVVDVDGMGVDMSQLHFYTYNEAFIDALPRPFAAGAGRPVGLRLLRHLSVALGYLPSWASPVLRARVRRPAAPGELPGLDVHRDTPYWAHNEMLRSVLKKVSGAARRLDLWPVFPAMSLAAGGKSYHWGGSFPMGDEATRRTSDRLGRVGPWTRVHLVDASVFPNVPATTFTLTIMANAHRIATESRELAP
jgi:choline dehydrogenase-like flavoprotein